MKEFLKKAIEKNGITPSELCLQSFNDNFEDAINAEWFNKDGHYEVLFYRNNIEHIAIISYNGMLMEYLQNLPFEFLPEPFKNQLDQKGEIMNIVLKNKGNKLEYELIIRDKQLRRHLIIISDNGEIKEEFVL